MFAVGVHLNLVVWVFASGLLGVVVQAQSGLVATSPCECSPVCSGNVTTLDCPDGRVVPRRDCPCCTVCAQKEGEACEEPMMPCDADFGLVCSPEGLCTAEVKCTADVDCPTNRFCLGNVCVNPCPILNPCQGALKGGECVTEGHRPVCRCPSGHSRNEAGDECVSVHGANSDCEHDGRFYSVRETFYDGLCRERCVCGEGGKVTCRPISCGPGLFPAGRHSNDDFCMELRNRPGTDECCVVVACTDNSPHIVTYSPVPLSSSHREDGHRAVLRFGPQHPPPQPITEEEYQRRIKDLEATLNQGGRATASPGDTHVRSNTDVDDKSHRVRVHGTKVVDDPILLPPEPITEEEHQRRLKEKEATLNQGDRKTSSSGGAHVSGGTSQGQESAIDQTENKDQKEDAEMKPGVDMESHKVIVHGTKVVDNPILLLPEPITEEEYQRRLKEKEATLKQSNQETSSSGGAHVSSDTIDQMEESENQTQVHVQEETTVEELDEQNVPTSTQEPDQKEDAEMKPEVDEESHQVTVSGTQEVDDPSEPLIGPITEEEHQRKIKDMEATLKQSDQESASPGDAHVSSDATQAQVTDQMEESSNQTEVPPHEETTVGELDEESLSATTQSPDQEDGAETEPSVDMESHKDMASGTEMEDGMETTTEISDDAQVTLSPVETQEEEQHQMEEKEEKEESTVLLSENVPEYTATEYPAVIVEYDKEGNPIRRVTVQQSVDVVTVEPELATVSPTEESSVGVSHVQSVREGKQVPDNEALEPSHTATSTTTTTTSTTTETSGVESSTISTVLEGRSEEKQSKLGVFKVLSKNHNSTTLNLPSTRGGELYYQVLETTSGLASEAEWKKMEVIPGQVVVLLEGLMPSTSYTLKWSGKDATASKLSVTTLVGCQLSPELYVGLGDSWNNGCRTKCSCTASGNQCQPRCQFYPGSNTNPSCVEKPHPEDPECCVDYSCEGDVVVQTDKATTLETSTRVASGGLPKLIVTNKTFRSITFAWDDFRSRNYDGGYVAEYRELENEQEFEETSTPWMRQEQVRGEVSPKGEMTIDGLKPSTLYQVRVSIFDDPELERLGSSTETITIKTEMGCNYKNSSYGIGEFYNGCEERCYCNPDGSVRCKERCAIPFFKKGSYANDPHCREQPTDLDECCVLGVCSGREDNAEYDPCANIACGPNTECVPYHIEVEEKTRYGVCNCLSGYTGNPDNLETGCQFDANASGEGMAMGGCTFKNNSYKAGESFYDNCDYHCLCHENTEISCNIRCPYRMGQELSEPGCKLVPSPDDSCCAIRVCNSTINTTAEHPNSSPSQITEGCTEGNQTYAKNETFYVGCHAICTCIGYGDKSCVPRCPANKEVMDSPETQCVTLTDPKDACCTVTVCDEPKVELEVKKEISGIMENSTMVEEEKMMSHNHSHVMDDNMEKNVTLQEAMEEEMMMKNMSETNMTMEGKNMTDVMMEEEKNMTIVEGEMMHKNMTMEEDMTEKNMTMDDGMMEDTTETLMSMDDENMMEMNMTMDEQADEKNMTAEDEMMMKENGTMMMNEERHREDHALVMLEKKNRASDGFEVEITDAVAINSTAVILHVFPSKSVMQQLNASRDPSFTVLYSLDSLEWLHDRVRPTQPSMFSTDVILEVGNLEPGRTYQFRVDFEGSVSSAIKATTFDASGHEPEHRQDSSIMVQGVLLEDYDNTTMCAYNERYYKIDQEFYDGCAQFCICDSDLQVECRPIDCPKNSRDLFDADCSEWDDDAPVTLEPPRCCPEPQCKTHSSCQYMGRKFSNFEDIPRELTGCSQQCTCRYGNVSCVDLCQPVSPDPPHDLPCPSEAAVKVTLPGETCCQAWQCASHTVAEFSFSDSTPDPQTSLFPGPSDFFPLPPLSLHPSEQTSFSLGQHRPGFSQEGEIPTPEAMAIDAHSILLHFTTPSIYIGLPGKLAIKFREEAKSGEEPGEWREEVLVPSGSLVSSSVWDHPLDGLSANTMYVMQVQLNVLGASENISSPIFTVTTQAAPETTSTTEPTTTTPLPDLEINPDLYASDITKNSAKITWRDFDENEMRYIDGIQVKYTAGGKLMPHFSQMFYRDNDQIILRDLMSGTEYTVDLTFIPHEGQTSKITSNKPITFFTLPEEDPYSFEIEARLGKVTARTVELFYSGVPEPAEKYVNVFTAVYLRNDEGASSTHFKLPKYEDKKFLFVDELKPDAQYEMWIEAYLSNGRKKKSNVLTVTTKAGELPKPERSEIDPALNQEPESSGDYYGAFVAVVIIAAIACLGFLALLVVLIRKQNHAKAHINSSKNNAAYDNPSYKVGDNTYDIEMNGMKGTNGARHPEEP
ncbi:uncharacterized protein LOC143018947 isoform X7 [Oratosquilla oratoria]|uniref:uncharacterized protein LOC143018947 isoform X7 n=1 Tax=Oratosquilla oratoria TaxID=337810 RepID=UPI003F75E9EF